MSALRDAAQQALEALTQADGGLWFGHQRAITALRAALAEPVQDPVAKVIATAPKRIWLDLGFDPADEDITFDQLFEATWSQDNATGWGIEYVRADLAAPPRRKPLTIDEIAAISTSIPGQTPLGDAKVRFARAIERAQGIEGKA